MAIIPVPTSTALYLLVLFLGHLCEATTFAAYEVQDRRLGFACDRDLCDTCAGPNTTGTCYNTGAPPPGPKCPPETLCATPTAGGCRQDVMCRPGTYRLADAGRINFVDVINLDGFEIRAWSDIDSSTTPFSCSGAFWSTSKTGLQQVTAEEPLVCITIGFPGDYVTLPISAAINPSAPTQSSSISSTTAVNSALSPISSSAKAIQDDAAKAAAVASINGVGSTKPKSLRPFTVNNVTDSARDTKTVANDPTRSSMAPPAAAPTANLTMNIGPDGEVLFDVASVCRRRMPPISSMTSIASIINSTTSTSMTSTSMDSTTVTSMSKSATSFSNSIDSPEPTDPPKDAGPGNELSGNAEAGAAGAAAGANGAVGAGLAAGAAAGAAVAGAVAGVAGGAGATSSEPIKSPNPALLSTAVPSVSPVVPTLPTVSLAPSSSAILSDIIPSSVAAAAGAQVAQDINSVLSKSSTSASPSITVSPRDLSDIIRSITAEAGAKVVEDIHFVQTKSSSSTSPPCSPLSPAPSNPIHP